MVKSFNNIIKNDIKKMQYNNKKYGFSIKFPAYWKQEKKLFSLLGNQRNIIFNTKGGLLEVSVRRLSLKVSYNKEHQEHTLLKSLNETISVMGQKVLPLLLDKKIGGVKNTAWGEFKFTVPGDKTQLFGMIYLMHKELDYIIKYFCDVELEKEIKAILDTLQFSSSPQISDASQNNDTFRQSAEKQRAIRKEEKKEVDVNFLYGLYSWRGGQHGSPVKMYVFRKYEWRVQNR